MKGWVGQAKAQGRLTITENMSCPSCKQTHQTQLIACEKHLWVSKKWFDGLEAAYSNVTKE